MKSKTIGTIISAVVLLMAVIAILGFIAYMSKEDPAADYSFYVEHNDEKIYTSKSDVIMAQRAPLEFKVKYANPTLSGYTVQVVPNSIPGKDFDFTVNGEAYSFQSEPDLTAGFDIQMGEDSFTIASKGGIMDILQAVYPQSTVGGHEAAATYDNMFTLVITSLDGTASVYVNFTVPELSAGVYISPEVIIF